MASEVSEPRPVVPGDSGATAEDAATPGEILTLPPLDEIEPGIPISGATGQPRRGKVMVAGMAFLYAAALSGAVALATAWWDTIHVATWPTSARLFSMAHVAAGSWQSVLLALALGLIGATMVSVPAIAGFNAWNGYRWSRIAGLVAVAVSGLAWFLNPIAWVGLPLTVVGAAILWTRPVTRYYGHWEAFRGGEARRPAVYGHLTYGPLPRYR